MASVESRELFNNACEYIARVSGEDLISQVREPKFSKSIDTIISEFQRNKNDIKTTQKLKNQFQDLKKELEKINEKMEHEPGSTGSLTGDTIKTLLGKVDSCVKMFESPKIKPEEDKKEKVEEKGAFPSPPPVDNGKLFKDWLDSPLYDLKKSTPEGKRLYRDDYPDHAEVQRNYVKTKNVIIERCEKFINVEHEGRSFSPSRKEVFNLFINRMKDQLPANNENFTDDKYAVVNEILNAMVFVLRVPEGKMEAVQKFVKSNDRMDIGLFQRFQDDVNKK